MLINLLNSNRITVLIGAGGCIDIGGPTTNTLTEEINSINCSNAYIFSSICSMLDCYYGPGNWNFEDFFHSLEMIKSQLAGWRPNTVKEYKPSLGAFVQPINSDVFNDFILIELKQIIIDMVTRHINNYNNRFEPDGNHKWFKEFWKNLNYKRRLDIATLNYDTCLERVFINYNDGYELKNGYYKFNPKKLKKGKEPRIMHLHGCVNFGHIPNTEDPNRTIFTEDFHDIYKYDSHDDARRTWFHRSDARGQSGESLVVGPIITGLRKTEKNIVYPYSEYNSYFRSALHKNDRLLIVGYSFGDIYLNKLINRFSALHGKKRRIVIITFCEPGDWHPDPSAMDVFNHDQYMFTAIAFKEQTPFESYSFNRPEIITSKDGCAKLCLGGFRNVAENHANEIINFLK